MRMQIYSVSADDSENKDNSLQAFINSVIIGGCRQALSMLPQGSVHTVVTSPPYWRLRDYQCQGQLGSENSADEYIENLTDVFQLTGRILREDGSLWINMGDKYHQKDLLGLPWRLIFRLKEKGWILRNAVIWHKRGGMPSSVKDRLNHNYEYMFHLTKNKKYYYNLDGVRIPHRWKRKERSEKTAKEVAALIPPSKEAKLNHKKTEEVSSIKPHNRLKGEKKNKEEAGEMLEGAKETENLTSRKRRAKRGGVKSPFSHNPMRQPGAVNSRAFHPKGKNPGSILSLPPSKSFALHPASFPLELCLIPILASCPEQGIILDPFAGSCTLLKAAKSLGRKFIGIELNPAYVFASSKELFCKSYTGSIKDTDCFDLNFC